MDTEVPKKEVLCVGIPGFTYISKGPVQIDKITYTITEGSTTYQMYSKLSLTDEQTVSTTSKLAPSVFYNSPINKQSDYGYFYDYVRDLGNGSYKHIISPVCISTKGEKIHVTVSDDEEGTQIKSGEVSIKPSSDTTSITAKIAEAKVNNCFGFVYIGDVWDVDLKITFNLYSYITNNDDKVQFGTSNNGQLSNLNTGSYIYIDSWETYYNPAAVNKKVQFELLSNEFVPHIVPNKITFAIKSTVSNNQSTTKQLYSNTEQNDQKPLSTYIPSNWGYADSQSKAWCRSGPDNYKGSYSLTAAGESTVLGWHTIPNSDGGVFMLASLMCGASSGRFKNNKRWYDERKFTKYFSGYKNPMSITDIIYPVYRNSAESGSSEYNSFMVFLQGKVLTSADDNLKSSNNYTLSDDTTAKGWEYLFSSYPYVTLQFSGTPVISAYIKTNWHQSQDDVADGDFRKGAYEWSNAGKSCINPLAFGGYMSRDGDFSRYLQIPIANNDTNQSNKGLKKVVLDEWQNSASIALQLSETLTSFNGYIFTNLLGSQVSGNKNITASSSYPNFWYPVVSNDTDQKMKITNQTHKDSSLSSYNETELYTRSETSTSSITFSDRSTSSYYKYAIQGYAFAQNDLANSNSFFFANKNIKLYLGPRKRSFKYTIQAAPGSLSAIDAVEKTGRTFGADDKFYLHTKAAKFTYDQSAGQLEFTSTDRKYIPYIYSNLNYQSGVNAALTNGSIKSININTNGTKEDEFIVGNQTIQKSSLKDSTFAENNQALSYYCITATDFTVKLPLPESPSNTYVIKINAFYVKTDSAGNNQIGVPKYKIKNGVTLCNGMCLVYTTDRTLKLTFSDTDSVTKTRYIESICAFALHENWWSSAGNEWPLEKTDTVYTGDEAELTKVVMPFMFCAAENVHICTLSNRKKFVTGVHIPSDKHCYIIAGFYQLALTNTVQDVIWATNVTNGRESLRNYINDKIIRSIPTKLTEPTDDYIKEPKVVTKFNTVPDFLKDFNLKLAKEQTEVSGVSATGNFTEL